MVHQPSFDGAYHLLMVIWRMVVIGGFRLICPNSWMVDVMKNDEYWDMYTILAILLGEYCE